MQDPWYKSTFVYGALGAELSIQIPHDVFSTQRIDEGTLLLLDHLPEHEPKTVLDMGCGYGALGLPIAAKYSNAKVEMVDRDLLAAKWSQLNAEKNKLANVEAYGSLGFRDVRGSTFDWILCNVPARIGRPFIKNLMELGCEKLGAGGELRVVVINDLAPTMKELQAEANWPLTEIAVGPRHTIFAMKRFSANRESSAENPARAEMPFETIEPEILYLRDQVTVENLSFDRPFDFGGDDQKRLSTSLPILIDALPRRAFDASKNILCLRSGYGILPLLCRKRWPTAKISVIERDLMGTTFLRQNELQLNLPGEAIEIRQAAHFPEAIATHERFDLILSELSPSAGENVALSELYAIHNALKPTGEALILCSEKIEKDWIRKFSQLSKYPVNRVLTRDGFSVVRISK
jgi:16S rRNA (guanine1207-N2)-methyltransferase